jgi:hypothetical protein
MVKSLLEVRENLQYLEVDIHRAEGESKLAKSPTTSNTARTTQPTRKTGTELDWGEFQLPKTTSSPGHGKDTGPEAWPEARPETWEDEDLETEVTHLCR